MTEDSIVRHLRAGQDRRERIDAAVAAFRRLAPEDYGHFLATIEADLGSCTPELDPPKLVGGTTPLLLASPAEAPPAPSRVQSRGSGDTLRDAVLALLADGRARSTVEIRSDLEVNRPVKPATLNTEVFTLRKAGLLRSDSQQRGRKHTLTRFETHAATSTGRRETAARAPRPKREKSTVRNDDEEDRPASARASAPSAERAPRPERKNGAVRNNDDEDRPAPARAAASSAERLYATAIGAHHLLSSAEELELAQRLETVEIALWQRLLDGPLGAEARRQLRAHEPPVEPASACAARSADLDRLIASCVIAAIERPTADQLVDRTADLTAERAALRAITAEADLIRDRFVTCNLRLVPATIRRHSYHRTTNLAMGDLIQEGNFGLLKAIPRFDYRRGLRFSTFATWWIRHYLVRARQNLGTEVRVPVHMHDLAAKVRRATLNLRRELGRDPNQSEIASTLKVSKKTLQTLEGDWLKYREALPSFDSVGEEGLMPSYLASDAALADAILSRQQDDDQLAARVACLSPLLLQIVRRRFGLGGIEPETLIQIGESMKLSRERIRQLEKKALSILRQALVDVTDVAA